MPPRLVRKAPDTYHHGDLRDALVQAALQDAEQGGPELADRLEEEGYDGPWIANP